ncbi:MAG TPA: DUF6454 family protein, partial [Bryobacteraceae bacterium]|nr:DUF6454 family protein [Bryobacteraceae bacterium]
MPQETQLTDWKQRASVTLQATIHHVQGIDVEGTTLWVSSVDTKEHKGYLSRFDLRSGKLLSQVQVHEGRRIHPGGLALQGNFVWVPVAEYHRGGPTTIQKRDKTTLILLSSFNVDDHIGCLAAADGYLIGGNWNSRMFYRW